MRIVYLSHNFYPEIGAPSARVLEMSKEWVKQGHEVTVVTGFPNYPTGVISAEYRGRLMLTENIEGIRVLRSWIYATPNEGFFKRTLNHLSLTVSSLVLSMTRLGKCDIIIATSPPFFPAFSGLIISWLKRRPFIFEVRDLWPAAIAELGVLKKSSLIYKILEKLELFLYRCASKVVVVTNSFKQDLMGKGIPETKIEVVFNGVEIDRFRIAANPKNIKTEYGLDGKFVVLYTGAHGMAHALDNFLYVADNLRETRDILFLFVGEGAMKKELQKTAQDLNLENVLFWPAQPRETMPKMYALADVCLVPLRNVPLFAQFIPSKIFEIMACGKPILASLEGEAADILNESGAAIVVPPENQNLIKQSILTLYSDENLRRQMSSSGQKYVSENFKRSILANHFLNIMGIYGHGESPLHPSENVLHH